MLPSFPDFKKLEIADKTAIEVLTSRFPAYSDFNFVSLWSYNTENDLEISDLNGNLVVKFCDYISSERFYSFIGNSKIDETVKTLLAHAKERGLLYQLKLVPEISILDALDLTSKFTLTEDPDNHDYVLSLSEHVHLETGKFYKHRKLIGKLYRDNPGFQVKKLDLKNNDILQKIVNLFSIWQQLRGKREDETVHELTALKRTLHHAASLNLVSLGIYNKEELIGFIIADTNHSEYIESHFLKYNPKYNGMNHLLHHLLAKHLENSNYQFINIEQDLGIDGLRKSKQSARPIHQLKKFIIKPKLTTNKKDSNKCN